MTTEEERRGKKYEPDDKRYRATEQWHLSLELAPRSRTGDDLGGKHLHLQLYSQQDRSTEASLLLSNSILRRLYYLLSLCLSGKATCRQIAFFQYISPQTLYSALLPAHFDEALQMPLLLTRSEEHTSELQSRGHLVCRLLLEKKKK